MVVVRNGGVASGEIAVLLLPTLFGFTAPSSPASANSTEQLISVKFPRYQGTNGAERTAPGGYKSPCINHGTTVLMPLDNIGTALAADPYLGVYLPQTMAQFAEVSIEEGEREVYVKDFVLPTALKAQSGIVMLKLEGANLEPHKLYKWTFLAFCDFGDLGSGSQVSGVFQRRELDAELKKQLEGATPLEQAKLYAQAGIWNETLALVSSLRASNPREWMELLQSVDLNEIASAPFLN